MPSDLTLPRSPEMGWTQQRLELLAWLNRNCESLGELYEAAIFMTYGLLLPGRMRLIAHSVREIANRLPDVFAGRLDRNRLEYADEVGRLAVAWKSAGMAPLGPPDARAERTLQEQATTLPVPRELVVKIQALLDRHEEVSESRAAAAERLFAAFQIPGDAANKQLLGPALRQWLDVTRWFVAHAHDSGRPDADTDWSEMKQQFELFEATLASLGLGFFPGLEELDEILERANA